jgi:hypothetical protein
MTFHVLLAYSLLFFYCVGEMVGGHTTDYVNSVIHKVEAGDLTGGILVQATRSYPKELHN